MSRDYVSQIMEQFDNDEKQIKRQKLKADTVVGHLIERVC